MTKMLLNAIVCAALCVSLTALGKDVETPKSKAHALAEEICTLTDIQKILDQTRGHIKGMLAQQFQGMEMTAEQREAAVEFQGEIMDYTFSEMSWDKMKDDYIELYASVYSVTELQALVDFYKSPVGQTMIAKTPELMREMMAIMQKRMEIIMPEIQRRTEAFQKRMQDDD